MCFICVTSADTSGHIESRTDAYTGSMLGGYGTAASATFVATNYINTVLGGVSWSATPGTGATVTYSFDFSAADSAIIYASNAHVFTDAEKAVTRTAMAEISELVNVTFVEASSSSSAVLHFYNGELGSNYAGLAGYYYGAGNVLTKATVGMDDGAAGFTKGNWQYETLLHEIGHALGLKHSGNYNANDSGAELPDEFDTSEYTVMSYNDGPNGPAIVMRELDITALQYLYGGSGYYGDSGDGTGTSGTSGDDVLGGLSTGDDIKGGLGSDVISGNGGNDTLYGGRAISDANDSADTIAGGTGDDLMYGNTGGDMLYGGSAWNSSGDGNDTIYGGLGNDTVYGNEGNDFLAGGGGVAHPVDQADTIYGGGGNDSILGNGDNDVIYADNTTEGSTDGADTVYGGMGNDNIRGGGGADVLWGQNGDDSLTGGSGVDIFYFHSNSGDDVIYDFTSGTDKLYIASNINSSGLTSASQIAAAVEAVSGWGYLDMGSSNTLWFYGTTSISANDIVLF